MCDAELASCTESGGWCNVREAGKLLLDGAAEVRVFDNRVDRQLLRELRVELRAEGRSGESSQGEREGTHVARVGGALDARLERRLYLLLHELLEVDVLGKKRVRLDRLGTGDAQSLLRVAGEEASQERASVGGDLVAESQRVGQDLRRIDVSTK